MQISGWKVTADDS